MTKGFAFASVLLSLGVVGYQHAAVAVPMQGSGKGYHSPATPAPAAAKPAPPPPVKAAPPAPAPVAQPVAPPPPRPAPPAPAPTVAAQPATLPPPRRPYEPPMPLEPGKSSSVHNGPNTTATGLRFAVQGVDPSDVLNIRSGPSVKHDVVGSIPPDGNGVIPLGGRRQIGPSVWREVSYHGVRGWVNDRFLVEEPAGQAR